MAPAHPPIPSVQARRPGLVSDLPRLGDRIRPSSLLSWPVVLFLILICVPPIALVILGANPNASTFDHVGLAVTRRHKWYSVAWIGLAAAVVLHGLNDWGRVNGQPLWIVVVAVSGILFLGFAKAGSGGTAQSTGQSTGDALPPAFRLRGAPARHAPVSPGGHPKPGAMSGGRSSRPWWEH